MPVRFQTPVLYRPALHSIVVAVAAQPCMAVVLAPEQEAVLVELRTARALG